MRVARAGSGALPALLLCVCLVVPAVAQSTVLIFDDGVTVGAPLSTPGPAEQAAVNLGVAPTVVSDLVTFDTQLASGTWSAVVLNHINVSGLTAGTLDGLDAYAAGGGAVAFSSWQAGAFAAHPLFATLGATPIADLSAADVHVWDPTDPIATAVTDPTAYDDPVGFGIDAVGADAGPGATAILGLTPTPVPGRALLIARNDRHAFYLGLFPQLIDVPCVGVSLMQQVLAEMLGISPALPGIRAGAVTTTPAVLEPGVPFDVDVEVTNHDPVAHAVRVDLFHGPGEPVPVVPSIGLETTTVMVPAGSTVLASLSGLPAPPTDAVWRLHALVNAAGVIPECILADNVASILLCFATLGCVAGCGDCNELGDGTSILDALVAAQFAAAISTPSSGQLCVCDVNGLGGISIVDALLMAQLSAGIPVPVACPGAGAADLVMAGVPPALFNPLTFELDACGPPAVDLSFSFSTDSGLTYAAATAASSSALTSPAPGTPTGSLAFDWDSLADVGLGARPATVDFRITGANPGTGTTIDLDFPGLMLVGGSCSATVDLVLTGMPLPISLLDDATGATDEILFPCGSGGSVGGAERIYEFVAPMTATYTISTCGCCGVDTSLLVRELDCQAGIDVACNDDTCSSFEAEVSGVPLVAGTPYYIVVDGWQGSTGIYQLEITSP